MFRKIAEEVQIQKIIAQIARREGITEAEVRSAMQEALQAGFRNPDPAIQAAWRQIPMKGNSPRPEEFIAWARVQGSHKNSGWKTVLNK